MDEYLFRVDYPDYRLVSRRYDGRVACYSHIVINNYNNDNRNKSGD